MKQSSTKYGLFYLLILGSVNQYAKANYEGQNYSDQNCCFRSYECSCNPLYCGAWDLQIQAGVNPIKWRNRRDGSILDCTLISPLLDLPLGSFRSLFRLPWVVGGQIGYHWDDNVRVYAEFNYTQAKAKSLVPPTLTVGQSYFGIGSVDKYKIFDAYVGARYYTSRCLCDRIAFFLGAQVGLTHHKRSRGELITLVFGGAVTPLAPVDVLLSNTVVSGGANFGFDVCICGNWSFVVTGEVIASCGPRFNQNLVVPVNAVTPSTNIFGGAVGTELRFPVTAGVRYSF